MKIIDVSSIQHPIIECRAAGTCDDATGTEDAVLLPDHAVYPGIPIELTYKKGRYRNKNTTEHDAPKSQSAAGTSTGLRPLSAIARCRLGNWFLICMGYLQCADHVPEIAQHVEAARAASVESNTNKPNKR